MKITGAILAIFSLGIFSCAQPDPNKQIDEGKVTGQVYQSKEIGWSIEIPEDWTVTTKDQLQAADEKGKHVLEKSTGLQIDTEGLKHLISFQNDRFNIFFATSQPVKEEFPGEYEQNSKAVNEMLYKAFIDQGIKVDSASGQEKIHGLEFNTFKIAMYAPKGGKIIFNQIMYSRLLNGFDFGVTISYNNERDRKTMLHAWKTSKFTKTNTQASSL